MILEINNQHVDAIHQMCDVAFGDNYITLDYIKEYILAPHKKGFILIEDHLPIGFILISFHNSKKIQKEILKEKEWFANECYHYNTIGIIQQIVIHPKFQKNGRARQLIKYSVEAFKSTIDLFLCNAWIMNNSTTPLRNALIKNDFTLKKTINNYWKEDSLNKGYTCKVCGNPPCSCSAGVYLLKTKAD